MYPNLAAGALVLVDSSAIVYLAEGEAGTPRRRAVESFFSRADAGELRLAASTMVWAELLARPLERGDSRLADRYRILLSDSSRITLREVDVEVAQAAAAVSASLAPAQRRKISQTDIVHVATALAVGADAILTNDEAWTSIPRCPRLLLVDDIAAGEEAEA